MITRGVRRQNKARREFLREPCDGLIVFGNACNNVANARKFFVRLATALQTPKSFSRGICSVPARALFPILAFAELLQGPFSPFWRLQNFCKRAFSHFGVCRTSARALFSILAFAELLQARFSPFWRLQKSCKDQKVSRGICSVAAKHFQKLCAAFRALSKTFFRDTDPHSFAELAFGMCFVQILCIVRSMYAHCEGVQIDIPSIFAPNKRDFT